MALDSSSLENAPAGRATLVRLNTAPVRSRAPAVVDLLVRGPVVVLRKSPFHSAVVVVALTAASLLISLFLRDYLQPDFFLPFTTAVLLSAWLCGPRAGVLATLLSAAAVDYFFLTPVFSLRINTWSSGVRMITFVMISLLLTWLISALRDSKDVLNATLASIEDGVVVTDSVGRITFLNEAAEGLTGWREAEAKRKPVNTVLPLIDERTRQKLPGPLERVIHPTEPTSTPGTPVHPTLVTKDGTEIPIEHSAASIRDRSGKLRGAILVFRNISTRKQLEEQIAQTHKMEAVGRLASNVAGDFNNVLTVITGYAELARMETLAGSPLRHYAEEILYAAERAAALTRQLLAFGKGQVLQPKLIDLNSALSGVQEMLRRMLGDKIQLILLPAPDLGRVKADPAQIEEVITNLAANAHDAMPGGGSLTIETSNVEFDDPAAAKVGLRAGPYVLLAVSDTGHGMNAETRLRIFEPFFTTKEQGTATGLGLSSVYGIVKQAEGNITVYSVPNSGTVFEIYWPRTIEMDEPVHRVRVRTTPKGSETILLVDDEEGVRKLFLGVLQSNGYEVLEATNGVEALRIFEKNQHKIDIVVTDVVMPQMNGVELGEKIVERNPNIAILYMSGFRDNKITSVSNHQAFLHKPFTPDVLLKRVREMLDARPGPP